MLSLRNLIGLGAIKAHFGGFGAAIAVIGTALTDSCDFNTLGQSLGGAVGAYVLGYIITWISPKNRTGGLY